MSSFLEILYLEKSASCPVATVCLCGLVVIGDWIDIFPFFLFASLLFIYLCLSLCPGVDIHAGRQKYQCWCPAFQTPSISLYWAQAHIELIMHKYVISCQPHPEPCQVAVTMDT